MTCSKVCSKREQRINKRLKNLKPGQAMVVPSLMSYEDLNSSVREMESSAFNAGANAGRNDHHYMCRCRVSYNHWYYTNDWLRLSYYFGYTSTKKDDVYFKDYCVEISSLRDLEGYF